MHKIYILRHPITKEVRYVGYTKYTLNQRLKRHISEAKRFKTSTHKINWIRSLLDQQLVPYIELIEETNNGPIREQFWIKHYKECGYSLINGSEGGDGRIGPFPEKGKQKLREYYKNNPLVFSDETKRKISVALKGRKLLKETIQKLKNKKRNEETKQRISNAHKGKILSEETKRKICQALKGKLFPNQLQNLAKARASRISKIIEQYSMFGDFMKIFPSARLASEETKVKASLIRDACTGRQKTAGGFIWKYAN